MISLGPDLATRQAQHRYRTRRVLEGPQGADVIVDGQRYVSFCSNDYLGLANHPAIVSAFQSAAERYGVGSGAAHLICGHGTAHHALEEELAAFTGRPRLLLFSTGYMANLGIIATLAQHGDGVFEDRLNHASLIDGALLSRGQLHRYPHNDLTSLARALSNTEYRRKLIVSDGVFSMDGDLAPLPDLAALAQQHNAWLMVDDAHGFGVLGQNGGGTVEHYALSIDEVPILMGTLGKAFGSFGAFVAGSEELIETLIQQARSYIYTTALPPAIAEASRASLGVMQNEPWRREHLRALIARFRAGAQQLGLALMPSPTPIQPIILGTDEKAMAISTALQQRGILIPAIRPPSVPDGSARLRVSLSAAHTESHIDHLLETLATIL